MPELSNEQLSKLLSSSYDVYLDENLLNLKRIMCQQDEEHICIDCTMIASISDRVNTQLNLVAQIKQKWDLNRNDVIDTVIITCKHCKCYLIFKYLHFLYFALVLGGDHTQHTDRTVTFEHKVSKLNMSTRTNEHNTTGTDTYMYTSYYMLI